MGGSGKCYTASELTLQQRRSNATTRQFQGFLKTLQSKLKLHLDDVARLQEVANMVKHALGWESVRELYWDDFEAALEQEVAKRVQVLEEQNAGGLSSRHVTDTGRNTRPPTSGQQEPSFF